ncbi:MAG: CBS domain-containing protein [Candidatus Aminicenantes bacterium]|nr:MAG: CBS domain-containing protein [Candidatus Aminicenantes bacterium]
MAVKETRISEILQKKEGDIFSVTPKTTVFEAIHLMASHKIGAVLVMDKDRIVGIFSERDYLNKIILEGHTSKETRIKDVMTTKVVFVTPDASIEEGLAIMTEKKCRHLPVLDNKKLIGIVSIGDLVRQIIKDQKVAIHYLTEYITLSY